jgi:hypothetical protein
MSVLNDDGLPLDLTTVLILFLMPNFTLVVLTILNAYFIDASKNHPHLNRTLGKLANCFSKGALDRIVRNMLRHFDVKKRQHDETIPMAQPCSITKQKNSHSSKNSIPSTSNCPSQRKYDANYLFLVPFQIDLLLTVFVYKILTRDVYPETCQSYLTTYYGRPEQVVCWLKNLNKNISNLSANITLHQYCTNQTITYINYEHNDVICTQYAFKLINIIDTVTNMFAWHQAVVFIVTKSVVLSYWYQHKLRRTSCWSNLSDRYCRIILSIIICSILFIYILVFIFILPVRFFLVDRTRVDLTRHLLYACSKFIVGSILHVNLYTLYQWHSLTLQMNQTIRNEKEAVCISPVETIIPIGNGEYRSPSRIMIMDDYLGIPSRTYLTPYISV